MKSKEKQVSGPGAGSAAEPEWRVTEAMLALARRLPGYVKLAWGLVRDPRVPRSARRWLVAAGIYNLTPLDPIPGIIPVYGQLDDYAVLLLAIRKALRASPEAVRVEHLTRVGSSEAQIDQDLREMRRIAGHVTRRAAWGVWAGVRFAAGVGMELSRQLLVSAARTVNPNPGTAPRSAGSAKEESGP
jgi:uncharacterized membrane protein YkvA (DUF1232 family)